MTRERYDARWRLAYRTARARAADKYRPGPELKFVGDKGVQPDATVVQLRP